LPTVVTSRASDDNLIDDHDSRTSDFMAPPLQARSKQPGKPAPAASDDPASDGTAGGGVSPNGTPAGGREEAPASGAATDKARPAVDDTVVDGVPALPADTIGSSRAARSKGSDAEQAPAGEKDQPPADQSPVQPPVPSFGPPPSAQPQPAVEDPTSAYSPTPAVNPGSDALVAPSALSSAGSATPAGDRPAQAEPTSVSPAAFAWEMPDPPAHSPSSPARTFLRSGASARKSPPPMTGPLHGGSGKAAAESLAASRGAAPKIPAAQPKRTARQAHLTVARVEPWSVMKFSFVVSLVAFVILFVAVSVLYGALAGLGVFDSLQRVVSDVTSSQGSAGVNAKAWFSASRVLGYTALLGSLNIVLITAMSTIGAVVYNLTSRLVGGVEVTLKETE
jgi:hypothetical protein